MKGKPFLNGSSFDDFSRDLFAGLVTATKQVNTFPTGEEHEFYSTSPQYLEQMQVISQRLLNLTQGFLNQGRNITQITDLDLNVDDVAQRFSHDVVEVVDEFFEEVDTFVDDAKGHRDPDITQQPASQYQKKDSQFKIITGTNVLRPQDKWREEIDNSYGPFIPRIREKVNAGAPLDPVFLRRQLAAQKDAVMAAPLAKLKSMTKEMESHMIKLGLKKAAEEEAPEQLSSFPHPYNFELLNLEYQPWQLEFCKEELYGPLKTTPFTYVDKSAQLDELLMVLKQAKEIAIDLEAHSYRSYQGFTCLMQISTRREDFIVDTIELRSEMYKLNEVFTNPNIVKVLHGADRDIEWLQRDFSLYIVNMFDTGQASRVLEFQSFALAYLLKYFCGVNADKQYQLADWRIRPLPAEMLKYAREDTHYLLYIYDRLRNEALSRSDSANLLKSIYSRSREICLNRYEKEITTPRSFRKLYRTSDVIFSPQQLNVFAGLYAWRDRLARLEDESTSYVVPNHMLFRIGTVMPTEVHALLSCCSPVPPLVRLYATDLVVLIQVLKDMPVEPSLTQDDFDDGPDQFYQPPPLPVIPGSALQRKFQQRAGNNTNNPDPNSASSVLSSSSNNSTTSTNSSPAKLVISTDLHSRENKQKLLVDVSKATGKKNKTPPTKSQNNSPRTKTPLITTKQIVTTANTDGFSLTILPAEQVVVSKTNQNFQTHKPLPHSLFTPSINNTTDNNEEDEELGRATAQAVVKTLLNQSIFPFSLSSSLPATDSASGSATATESDGPVESTTAPTPSSKNPVVLVIEEPLHAHSKTPEQAASEKEDDEEESPEQQKPQSRLMPESDVPQSLAQAYKLSKRKKRKASKKANT